MDEGRAPETSCRSTRRSPRSPSASRLRDVKGVGKDDINTARNARQGREGHQAGPELRGQAHRQGGVRLHRRPGRLPRPRAPASALDGALPRIAMMLGPKAFQQRQGRRARHAPPRDEARRALPADDRRRRQVARGRGERRARASTTWARPPRLDHRKGMGKVEQSLLHGERAGNTANTELLAYAEGFINMLAPAPPRAERADGGSTIRPALYQLRRTGERVREGRTLAADALAVLDRQRARPDVKTRAARRRAPREQG